MPRRPVTFLNEIFPTQTLFEKFVKKIIYIDIGTCNDIKNKYPEKYSILTEILKRHPDWPYKSENMCNMKIVKDTLNRKALKIMIIKNYGGVIDISWRCAISGKHKTSKNELMSAMRSSVDEQTYQFRTEHKYDRCQLCDSSKRLDVDHNDTKNSAFDELAYNFIQENNEIKIPNEFGESNDTTHRRIFLEKDKCFRDKWVEYHRKHASLRMLCHNCNIRRPKTKSKLTSSYLESKCSKV